MLQCSECRSVIFPQEVLLEGVYQIVDYFLYSDSVQVVSTPDLFDPPDYRLNSQARWRRHHRLQRVRRWTSSAQFCCATSAWT